MQTYAVSSQGDVVIPVATIRILLLQDVAHNLNSWLFGWNFFHNQELYNHVESAT